MKTARVGDVGDRIVLAGTVISATRQAGEFGNETLFKIKGAQGELAYWISSKDVAEQYPTGTPITVRCTVKKYKLIQDDLWVHVSRGTIVEDALAIV